MKKEYPKEGRVEIPTKTDGKYVIGTETRRIKNGELSSVLEKTTNMTVVDDGSTKTLVDTINKIGFWKGFWTTGVIGAVLGAIGYTIAWAVSFFRGSRTRFSLITYVTFTAVGFVIVGLLGGSIYIMPHNWIGGLGDVVISAGVLGVLYFLFTVIRDGKNLLKTIKDKMKFLGMFAAILISGNVGDITRPGGMPSLGDIGNVVRTFIDTIRGRS